MIHFGRKFASKSNRNRVASFCELPLLCLLFDCGCSSDGQVKVSDQDSIATNRAALTSDSMVNAESAGMTPVSIVWSEKTNGTTKKSSDSLSAVLTNNTSLPQQGRLVVVAAGLDGREISRSLGTFKLDAKATKFHSQ